MSDEIKAGDLVREGPLEYGGEVKIDAKNRVVLKAGGPALSIYAMSPAKTSWVPKL